jgi:SAM-dependent methyltransferase
MTAREQAHYAHDLEQTLQNRERLRRNANLLYWYEELYRQIFTRIPNLESKQILEIGSGTSPLKLFYPRVSTSDVLNLPYLEHVFDCHEIDCYDRIPDHSLDVITLTNVLHHLRDPLKFLGAATVKLKPGGQVILVEPYFSLVSYPIYKLLHHERVDFDIDRPALDVVDGPLSSSNQAVPYMLFVSRPGWLSGLSPYYDTEHLQIDFFSSLSYMMTGGISRISPIPASLYRRLFAADYALARVAPKIFASFFIARLSARGAA